MKINFKQLINKIKKNEIAVLSFYFVCIVTISTTLVTIFEHNKNESLNNLWDGLWWTIVSITTTGYGDRVPITVMGRIVGIFTMLAAVSFVGVVSGRIASILVEKTLKEGRGLINLSHLKDHFVICGWKKNMTELLDSIFTSNPELNPEEIVIAANIEIEQIELFKQQNPKYKNINILRGEQYNENVLINANVSNAKKIMILADESKDASFTEIDSKTIMVAMTLTKLTKNVSICAELLDRKFEPYLENAHVDEIVYSNEYSQLLLAKSVGGVGIAKVINDLLDTKTASVLRAEPIDDKFVNKPFHDLKDYYHSLKDCVLIGLLKNIGSYYERKKESIREAQKTVDISKLVVNLQQVKKIKSNDPYISPPDDFIIPAHCYAVVIRRQRPEDT